MHALPNPAFPPSIHRLLFLLGALFALAVPGSWEAGAASFTSGGPITIPNLGATRTATPYPSTVVASGIAAGSITSVKVTLNNLTHPRPDDLQMVLVAPPAWGAKLVFLSDGGGAGTPVANATITFDDAAASVMPDAGPLASNSAYSFKPSCYDAQNNIATEFPGVTINAATEAAGPGQGRSATFTSVFGGAHDPNGTWSLYVTDDVATTDNASFASWTLEITTSPTTVGTTTVLASSANPSTTGGSVTFTATVKKQTDSTAVTSGTVTFREGGTILSLNVAVNGSGVATYQTSGLTEGDHQIVADYNPGTGFLASTGSLNQRVDNATVRTGNTFANLGSLTLSTATGAASVFPSKVFVSGLSGSISKLTLSITNLSINSPDDLELLLVGPGGQNFIVLGDAGGTGVAVNGIILTFDDTAASQVADTTPPASGTYKPSSYNTSSLPSPAPAAPYSQAAPQGSSTFATVFAGAAPNGTWRLFAYDDVTGSGGTIAGGWALTFTTTSDAATTTTVSSTPNPSLLGATATFQATVTSGGSPVTSGTVTFREGTTTLAAGVAVDGTGVATFSTAALTEGTHGISADYNGSPGLFNLSSGSASHRVDRATVVVGSRFCNPGPITIAAVSPSTADVYPSHVTVSGFAGTTTSVIVDLKGLSIDRPDDLELLLVDPTGAAFVLIGDAGGTGSAVAGIDLVLRDDTANFVPDTGPLVGGTYKPTNWGSTATTFPGPAPGPPYNQPGPGAGVATLASVFNGRNPSGQWSLYAMDDVGGGGALISGGWCLTFDTQEPPVANPDIVFRDQNRSVKVPVATLLGNDTDADGTTPSLVGVSASSAKGAAVHVVGSWVSYEAVVGNNTEDSFTYTITDAATTVTGTVTVLVQRPDTQTSNLFIYVAGTDVVLALSGIPGRQYQFQYTGNLTPPVDWTNLGPPVTVGSSGKALIVDPAPPFRVYRAIEP